MAEGSASCAHCGEEGVGFKRCSVCKEASYCGAACQNANWKRHKKTCAPPVTLKQFWVKVKAASVAEDWRGILKWEGRIEELMAPLPDGDCEKVLGVFAIAHQTGWNSSGSKDNARSFVRLTERRIPLLGNLQRFRDQGDAIFEIAKMLSWIDKLDESFLYYQRARDVGAAHGFFSIESRACQGLGAAAMNEGRHEEGVELLRNALVAGQLNELDDPTYEVEALEGLIQALFVTHAIDELEPLVLRYREAAKAQSNNQGTPFTFSVLDSFIASARLHEVLCLCTPRWEPLHTARLLLPAWPSSVCLAQVPPRPREDTCTY